MTNYPRVFTKSTVVRLIVLHRLRCVFQYPTANIITILNHSVIIDRQVYRRSQIMKLLDRYYFIRTVDAVGLFDKNCRQKRGRTRVIKKVKMKNGSHSGTPKYCVCILYRIKCKRNVSLDFKSSVHLFSVVCYFSLFVR